MLSSRNSCVLLKGAFCGLSDLGSRSPSLSFVRKTLFSVLSVSGENENHTLGMKDFGVIFTEGVMKKREKEFGGVN
jgi:hypothetical protein